MDFSVFNCEFSYQNSAEAILLDFNRPKQISGSGKPNIEGFKRILKKVYLQVIQQKGL